VVCKALAIIVFNAVSEFMFVFSTEENGLRVVLRKASGINMHHCGKLLYEESLENACADGTGDLH
jgi:hypothetical protein